MTQWGTQFAREIGHRSEGQSDFALDLIDLLQKKAEDFNKETPRDFRFTLRVTVKGEDVEVTNGYKTASAFTTLLPGSVFVRIDGASEGTIGNVPYQAVLSNTREEGFVPVASFRSDGLPSECADPEKLAEWMIHEIFEP